MEIQTARLTLHAASQDEMRRFIQAQTDPNLAAAYREMLQGCLTHPEAHLWHALWMIDRKDGFHVGELSFKGHNPDGSVEIGYGITPPFRGRGYATEAVGAAVFWALRQPGVTRVEAETAPDNAASLRVLEKCSFIPTGSTGQEGPRFVRLP
jgi:ribosomal-protein-alanine N-acetyltransferase